MKIDGAHLSGMKTDASAPAHAGLERLEQATTAEGVARLLHGVRDPEIALRALDRLAELPLDPIWSYRALRLALDTGGWKATEQAIGLLEQYGRHPAELDRIGSAIGSALLILRRERGLSAAFSAMLSVHASIGRAVPAICACLAARYLNGRTELLRAAAENAEAYELSPILFDLTRREDWNDCSGEIDRAAIRVGRSRFDRLVHAGWESLKGDIPHPLEGRGSLEIALDFEAAKPFLLHSVDRLAPGRARAAIEELAKWQNPEELPRYLPIFCYVLAADTGDSVKEAVLKAIAPLGGALEPLEPLLLDLCQGQIGDTLKIALLERLALVNPLQRHRAVADLRRIIHKAHGAATLVPAYAALARIGAETQDDVTDRRTNDQHAAQYARDEAESFLLDPQTRTADRIALLEAIGGEPRVARCYSAALWQFMDSPGRYSPDERRAALCAIGGIGNLLTPEERTRWTLTTKLLYPRQRPD